MKTIKILFFLLTLFANTCFGQSNRFNPSNSYSDISFSGGVYNNAKDDVLGEGVIYSIDYGQFFYNGIGCRGGMSYIDGLDNNINAITLPLSFAWRTPTRDRRNIKNRVEDAMGSLIYSSSNMDFRNAFVSLLSLRTEFNIGLTPGYICGSKSHNQHSSFDRVSIDNRFMLTADIGIRASLRVWRLNLMISPQYHHLLTNNYIRKSTSIQLNNTRPSQSFISFSFGGAFML